MIPPSVRYKRSFCPNGGGASVSLCIDQRITRLVEGKRYGMSSIYKGTSWWESGPRGPVPANVRKWVNISGVSGFVCGTAVILLGLFAGHRIDLLEVIVGALIVPTWLYLALWVRHLGPESSRRLRPAAPLTGWNFITVSRAAHAFAWSSLAL